VGAEWAEWYAMTPEERFLESMKVWDPIARSEVRLSRSPILRALSSIRKSGTKTLLMGGQACVFYGAAEFSRDLDRLILADPQNLIVFARRSRISMPTRLPSRLSNLVIWRGDTLSAFGVIDPGSRSCAWMEWLRSRGVAEFAELWELEVFGEPVDLLGIEDLVRAKKYAAREGLADDSTPRRAELLRA